MSALWDVAGAVSYARESILPTGAVEILFNLGAAQHLIEPGRRARYDRVWVSGLQQRPLLVEAGGPSHLLGLRLTTIGAWRFFGMPMHEISNQVLELDQVLGRSLLELHERLAAHRDPRWRLRCLAGFAARRLRAGPETHPAVLLALQSIDASRGQCRTHALSEQAVVSQKHLIDRFHVQVGLSPKAYSRIVRFRHALAHLQMVDTDDLGRVALDSGYFDQSHFNRDFREHAGVSPTEYLRRRVPDDMTAAMASA